MNDNTTAADLLDGAADYLDTYGWQQGEYGEHGGPRCALGALASATGLVLAGSIGDVDTAELRPALRAIGARILAGCSPALRAYLDVNELRVGPAVVVWNWNDTPDRTEDDVTNCLRKTALTLREQA